LSEPGSAVPNDWDVLTDGPLSARSRAVGAWTGQEVLVIGGEPKAGCPPGAGCTSPDFAPLADGAAFNPETGQWRPIAMSPFGFSDNTSTVFVEDSLYVLAWDGNRSVGGRAGFLRYSVAKDWWEELSTPPSEPRYYRLAKSNGLIVAFAGSDENGALPDFVFDVETGVWNSLADDPMSPSYDRTVVVVDDGLYLFAQDIEPNPGSEMPSLLRVAKLDVSQGIWEQRADSQILGDTNPVVIGSDIVFAVAGQANGGETNNWGRYYPYGGIYNIDKDQWSTLPEAAIDRSFNIAGVINDDKAGYHFAQGAILELDQWSWITIPTLSSSDAQGRTVVAAGKDLFVFGGEKFNDAQGVVLDQSYLWRLTSADSPASPLAETKRSQSTRWDAAVLEEEGQLLRVEFIGGSPGPLQEQCNTNYEIDVAETAETVTLTVFQLVLAEPIEWPEGTGCNDLGYFRQLQASLSEPLGQRTLIDGHDIDESVLLSPSWLPDGWVELNRKADGPALRVGFGPEGDTGFPPLTFTAAQIDDDRYQLENTIVFEEDGYLYLVTTSEGIDVGYRFVEALM